MANRGGLRWHQRLENFGKALQTLASACDMPNYSDLERAGLIQRFEFTIEMSWKVLSDLLDFEGITAKTPRSAIRAGFAAGYLSELDTESLLDAVAKRNLLSHTYAEATAIEAERLIKNRYYPALDRVYAALEKKRIS